MTQINTTGCNNLVCSAFMPAKAKEKTKTENSAKNSDKKDGVLLNQLNQNAIFNMPLIRQNNPVQDYANAAIKLRQADQDLIKNEAKFAQLKAQGGVTPELEAEMEDYRKSVEELRDKTYEYQDAVMDEIAGPMDAKLDTET